MQKFEFPEAFFVTATDTEMGKTVISAMLMIGLQGHYWKPIRTGTRPYVDYTDNEWIQMNTGLPDERFFSETYLLKHHVSPHLAARLEGLEIDIEKIKMPGEKKWKHLIVEGAGGLLVPINDSLFIIDVIKHLNLPALIVSRSTLGTINHTLLTVEKLRERKIPVMGVIMNGPKNSENKQAIEKYGKVKVLAEIEEIKPINNQSLQKAFDDQFYISQPAEIY
jgi:dethiobiotin synthetase